MIPAERQQFILSMVRENGGVISLHELISRLGVSHMTVRRDVQKLERDGAVISVSGGIELSNKLLEEPSHFAKESMSSEEKRRIGQKASEYIPENSCVYLDAGTTSLALAQSLAGRDDLTIVTNDFEVINYLMPHTKSSLIHVGGQVLKSNCSTVGPLAAKIIGSLSIDVAFLSASSWNSRGVTTPDIEKVTVKQGVLKASKKHILICDSSKFGQVATFIAFPLDKLDMVISDGALDESGIRILREQGIELHLV